MRILEEMYKSGQTVFAIDDVRVLLRSQNPDALKVQLKYAVDAGKIQRLRRGVYALYDYNSFELAQKLVRPSYISLDTALRKHGIVHQHSSIVTCIAPYSREITIDSCTYRYHKIKESLLSLPLGILYENHYAMASPERALCDAYYLGFQPDEEGYSAWDISLLKKLKHEYGVPKVSKGLSRLLHSSSSDSQYTI